MQGTPRHAFDTYEATLAYRSAQADTAIAVVFAHLAAAIAPLRWGEVPDLDGTLMTVVVKADVLALVRTHQQEAP